MALSIVRAETVLSLQQMLVLEGSHSKAPCPDCPVSDIANGGSLPLVTFSSGASGMQKKRVRSFGDIQLVPDMDDIG